MSAGTAAWAAGAYVALADLVAYGKIPDPDVARAVMQVLATAPAAVQSASKPLRALAEAGLKP